MSMTEELSFKEQTFILSLISALITVLAIIGGFLGLPFAEKAFDGSLLLQTMSWTFYFVKKKAET